MTGAMPAAFDLGVVRHELAPGLRDLEAEPVVHGAVVEHTAAGAITERHPVDVVARRDVRIERPVHVLEEVRSGQRHEVLLRVDRWKSDPELYSKTSSMSPVDRRVFTTLSPSAPCGRVSTLTEPFLESLEPRLPALHAVAASEHAASAASAHRRRRVVENRIIPPGEEATAPAIGIGVRNLVECWVEAGLEGRMNRFKTSRAPGSSGLGVACPRT